MGTPGWQFPSNPSFVTYTVCSRRLCSWYVVNKQLQLTNLYRRKVSLADSADKTDLPNKTGMPADLMKESKLNCSDETNQLIPDHAVARVGESTCTIYQAPSLQRLSLGRGQFGRGQLGRGQLGRGQLDRRAA